MVLYNHKEVTNMKQVIYVTTMSEAISLAMKWSNNEPVLIAEHLYDSDKDFEGVIIYVKRFQD